MKFVSLFLFGIVSATELTAFANPTKVASANAIANAKGATINLSAGSTPAAMSAYHWGLLDAESQLELYRKSEYKKKELENDIAHH